MSAVVDVCPRRDEVAIVNLPAGSTVRVHSGGGTRDWVSDLGEDVPFIATIPGDREYIGWGAVIVRYIDIRVVRNGKHRRDRLVWQKAVKSVQRGGVTYLRFEQQDYYGKQVWVATGFRGDD